MRVVAELWKLRKEGIFEISVKDMTTDSGLFERYRNTVPAIAIDGKVRQRVLHSQIRIRSKLSCGKLSSE